MGFASFGLAGHVLVQRLPDLARSQRASADGPAEPAPRRSYGGGPGNVHRPPPIRFRRLSALELGTMLAGSAVDHAVRRTKAGFRIELPFSDSGDRCLVHPSLQRYPQPDEHPV